MSDVRFIYVTAAHAEQAEIIARTVVEERLAACANILGAIQSIYRWNGKLEKATEVALVLKTVQERQERLIGRVRELHSYECPAILVLPVLDGNPQFLSWIRSESSTQ